MAASVLGFTFFLVSSQFYELMKHFTCTLYVKIWFYSNCSRGKLPPTSKLTLSQALTLTLGGGRGGAAIDIAGNCLVAPQP